MAGAAASGTRVPPVQQRFAASLDDYEKERNKDKADAQDARASAKRSNVIAIISVIGMIIFGVTAFAENASIKEHRQDHFFGVPENSMGVRTGPAYGLQDIGSPSEAEITRDLALWAGNAFSVATDSTAIQRAFQQTYLFLDGAGLSKYNAWLAVNNGANSPYVLGRSRSLTVRVTKNYRIPGGSMTWDLGWQDTMFQQPGGRVMNTVTCELYVNVGYFKDVPQSKYDPDGAMFRMLNPYRIAIKDWTPVHAVGVDPTDCGLTL